MSFDQVHRDNVREAALREAEAKLLKRLQKKESDIQYELAKVQDPAHLSRLNEELRLVREEISRSRPPKT